MDYLSHLYLPGALALWCALIFSLSTMWGYAQALSGDSGSLTFARRAYGFFALSIVLAAVLLSLLLMMRDFRIEYVYQYSGLELPGYYQFAAFWAGQKGSFLIWLLWGTLLGLLVRRTAGKNEPAVMGIYTLTLIGLLLILVRENPFVMLGKAPVDGDGPEPPAPGQLDGDPPADHVRRLRGERHPLRLRHGRAVAAASTTAGRRAPSPGPSAASWCSAPPS